MYVLKLACFSGGHTKKLTELETILHHSLTTVRRIWNEIKKVVQAIQHITIHQKSLIWPLVRARSHSFEEPGKMGWSSIVRELERERGMLWAPGWVTDAQSLTISQVTTKVLVNLLLNFPAYNLSFPERQTAKRTWLEMEDWVEFEQQSYKLAFPSRLFQDSNIASTCK